jgi:hypothetical protein
VQDTDPVDLYANRIWGIHYIMYMYDKYVYFKKIFDSWEAMHEVHDKSGPILIRDKAFRPCTLMVESASTLLKKAFTHQ